MFLLWLIGALVLSGWFAALALCRAAAPQNEAERIADDAAQIAALQRRQTDSQDPGGVRLKGGPPADTAWH